MTQDIAKLREEAERGLAPSQAVLGISLLHGYGVPQDYAEAHHWLTICDQRGVPRARWNLGLIYMLGLGVPRDLARAHDLFEKAAHRGEIGAAIELARLAYAEGRVADAASWYARVQNQLTPQDDNPSERDPMLTEARRFLALCDHALPKPLDGAP